MKKLIQTRLHVPGEVRGNCFPTVIACFLDLDSPEDVFQIQEHYDEPDWNIQIYEWLLSRGWEWSVGRGHLFNDEFYLVSGKSTRNPNVNHVVIYQNGELYHDPHPDQSGVLEPFNFEYLEKIQS